MKNTLKRVLSVLLTVVMIFFSSVYIFADEQNILGGNDAENIVIADPSDFSEKTDLIADADVVTIDSALIEQCDTDQLQNILDNGTDLLVIGDDIDSLRDIVDVSAEQQDTDAVKAAYISKQNGKNCMSLVCYEPVYDVNKEVSNDEYNRDIDNLREIAVFNNEQIVNDMTAFSDAEIDELAIQNEDSLNGFESVIDGCYHSVSKHYYFMKKGSGGGVSTIYNWYENTKNVYETIYNDEKYSTIGSIDIILVCKELENVGTTMYDNVFACVQANTTDDKMVKKFDFSLINDSAANSKIVNASDIDFTGNNTCTSNLETTYGSEGESVVSESQSYSYNCDLVDVVSQFTYAETKTWITTTNNPRHGQTYEILPSIIVETKDGASNECSITGKCTYLKVSDGMRTYTINTSCEATIRFKNHEPV